MVKVLNDMKKNIKNMGYGLWVMVALLVSAPVTAQDFQSTSTMQGTGSDYAPQVTEVGATSAADMATTTESAPARTSGPRRINVYTPTTDPNAPLGDAVWPLLALACVYMVYSATRVYRRKRRA